MFYFRDYQELWYFLFPNSNLFVILNICYFILTESLGSEFCAKRLLQMSEKNLWSFS